MNPTRQALHTDIDSLLNLQQQYWNVEHLDHFDTQRNRQMISYFLNNPQCGALFVAEEQPSRLCGYIIACLQYSFEYGGLVAAIDEFYVAAHARSLGIGRMLFMQLETYLRSLDGKAIVLEVDHQNTRASAFYAKQGFEDRTKYQTMLKEMRPYPGKTCL